MLCLEGGQDLLLIIQNGLQRKLKFFHRWKPFRKLDSYNKAMQKSEEL